MVTSNIASNCSPIVAGATPSPPILGSLLIGVGQLVLFRHGASLGGFGVLALYAQRRFGWSTGAVQMLLDGAVVVTALAVPSRLASPGQW